MFCCLFILFVVFYVQNTQREQLMRRIITKKRRGVKNVMLEIVNSYIGRECAVYTMNAQIIGTVKEVSDGWLLLDNGKDTEAINLDYIIRISPYTRKKRAKKADASD